MISNGERKLYASATLWSFSDVWDTETSFMLQIHKKGTLLIWFLIVNVSSHDYFVQYRKNKPDPTFLSFASASEYDLILLLGGKHELQF